MKDKLLKLLNIDKLFDHVNGYVEARLKIFKLQLQEDSSKIFSEIVILLSQIFMALWLCFFLSVSFAYFLGELTGSVSLGFFILSLCYAFLFLFVYTQRLKLKKLIMDKIIQMSMQSGTNKEDKQLNVEQEKHEK